MDASSVARESIGHVNTALAPPICWSAATAGRWCVVTTLYALLLVSCLLAARHLASSSQQPMDAVLVLAVIIPSAAAAALQRIVWWQLHHCTQWWERIMLAAPSLMLLLIALPISFTPTASSTFVALWSTVVLAECTGWLWLRFMPRASFASAIALNPAKRTLRVDDLSRRSSEGEAGGTPVWALDSSATQWSLRTRAEDGTESIRALMRADFAPGERTQSLHVAFCPPLSTIPEVSLEQVAGKIVSVKAAQVQSFGARIELRLPGDCEEACSVVVQIRASCSESQQDDRPRGLQ